MAKLAARPQAMVKPDQTTRAIEMIETRFQRSAKRAMGTPNSV